LVEDNKGKKPIGTNNSKIERIEAENIVIRKRLEQTSTNEQSLHMLIKSSKKSHEKERIGYKNKTKT